MNKFDSALQAILEEIPNTTAVTPATNTVVRPAATANNTVTNTANPAANQQAANQQQANNNQNKPGSLNANHPVVQELVKAKDPTAVITALNKLGVK